MVEAAGQLFPIFRKGLDYTFILLPGCGACYSRLYSPQILVLAPHTVISQSISLYRAGLELASFLPLGIAFAAFAALGFTDVSSVFTLPLQVKATHIDRTRVRK